MTLKSVANLITDTKVIVGTIITILGVIVWVTISWTALLNRVTAIEEVQDQRSIINKDILEQLGDLKLQQAVIGATVDGIKAKTDETNNILKELIKFIKQ